MKEALELLDSACKSYGKQTENTLFDLRETNSKLLEKLEGDKKKLERLRQLRSRYESATMVDRYWVRIKCSDDLRLFYYFLLNKCSETINVRMRVYQKEEVERASVKELLPLLRGFLETLGWLNNHPMHQKFADIKLKIELELARSSADVLPYVGSSIVFSETNSELLASCASISEHADSVRFSQKTPAIGVKKSSELLQYFKKLVSEMNDLFTDMSQIPWNESVLSDPVYTKKVYDTLMERLNGMLKAYKNRLILPSHPDKWPYDNGELFKTTLQPTYEKYQGYRDTIRNHVESRGLKGLSYYIPAAEQLSTGGFDAFDDDLQMQEARAAVEKLSEEMKKAEADAMMVQEGIESIAKNLGAGARENRILQEEMVERAKIIEGMERGANALSDRVQEQKEEMAKIKQEMRDALSAIKEQMMGEKHAGYDTSLSGQFLFTTAIRNRGKPHFFPRLMDIRNGMGHGKAVVGRSITQEKKIITFHEMVRKRGAENEGLDDKLVQQEKGSLGTEQDIQDVSSVVQVQAAGERLCPPSRITLLTRNQRQFSLPPVAPSLAACFRAPIPEHSINHCIMG